MEIMIENKRLYIWALIAICGEVLKQDLIDSIESSPQHTYAELRKLKEEKLILEAKTEFGPVLRLAHPKGTEMLDSLPPLKEQYDLMTSSGQQGNSGRFHNKGQVLKKRLERSKIILIINEKELAVNNIRIQYIKKAGRKTNTTDQPPTPENENCTRPENEISTTTHQTLDKTKFQTTSKILPTEIPNISYVLPEEYSLRNETCEDLLKKASFQKPNYFTSNIVKRYKDGSETYTQTLSINPSRMQGAVMGSNSMVAFYYMENEKIKVTQKAEKAMTLYLDRIYKEAYGNMLISERRSYAKKGIAIILTGDDAGVKDYINYPGDNKANITGIYSRVYLVNARDKDRIEKIITSNYEQDIIEQIFDDEEISKAKERNLLEICDAVTEERISVEAVSMNIVKLEKTLTLLENTKAELEVFCTEEQQKNLKDMYRRYKDRVTITVLDNLNI